MRDSSVFYLSIIALLWSVLTLFSNNNHSKKEKQNGRSIETWLDENALDQGLSVQSVQSVTVIPNIIWTFWDGESLPLVVQHCIGSWKKHNSSFDIRVLDRTTLKDYIPDGDQILNLPRADGPAHLADFVRAHVIAEYGGIWMDASILCLGPITPLLKGNYDFIGFFMPNFTTQPKWPIIENWFIAASPRSPFIDAWRDEFMRSNLFSSNAEYLKDLKERGIDLQNLPYPEYLTMHAAAQVVLQSSSNRYKILALDATQGPFKYLSDNGWDSDKAFRELCKSPEKYGSYSLVKMRGSDRQHLEEHPTLFKCVQRL